ncbi:MAG TPA: IS5 family transposase [Nitrososphaeraceae archaeon]
MICWSSYNRSLVRRGEILFAYDFLDVWDSELARMNENKEGKKYRYPNSFILVIGYIRVYFHLPYRQTEGIIKATGKNIPNHPSYGQICRRLSRLEIDSSSRIDDDDDDDDDIVIAIDSTGIKVTNRGQWLRDKWNTRKKGYLKIHIAVNVKTKEILSLEVTDEKVHEGKVMVKLVEYILKSNNNNNNDINIKSALADGSYDSNKNFKYLYEKKILPGIKIRKNSITSTKNTNTRNKEVTSQQQHFDRWKKKRKYGYRWMAETAFSSLKRMFGEYTCATKFQNMVKEMILKVSLYNLFRRMA